MHGASLAQSPLSSPSNPSRVAPILVASRTQIVAGACHRAQITSPTSYKQGQGAMSLKATQCSKPAIFGGSCSSAEGGFGPGASKIGRVRAVALQSDDWPTKRRRRERAEAARSLTLARDWWASCPRTTSGGAGGAGGAFAKCSKHFCNLGNIMLVVANTFSPKHYQSNFHIPFGQSRPSLATSCPTLAWVGQLW